MKKSIFLLVLLVCSSLLFSQSDVKTNTQSNAELFSNKSGRLIKKEFKSIPGFKKSEIDVIHFTDLIDGTKTSAVKFSLKVATSYSTDTKVALLDADEIDGLIKSLKLIKEKIIPTIDSGYTEISFKSRSGFEAGCYSSKDTWKLYLKLEKFDSNSYIFFEKDDLDSLIVLLEYAKSLL